MQVAQKSQFSIRRQAPRPSKTIHSPAFRSSQKTHIQALVRFNPFLAIDAMILCEMRSTPAQCLVQVTPGPRLLSRAARALQPPVHEMCGRFTCRLTLEQMVRLYHLTPDGPRRNPQPRYNIRPGTTIDVVIEREGKRELVPMRWGLVPSWWKKPLEDLNLATFNARVEALAEKSFFRDTFIRTRCIIPASGYYEWHDMPSGKQPYYFTAADGAPLSIAGLWNEWYDKDAHRMLKSCAMIITSANDFVGQVHDRMPALLKPFQFDAWLTARVGLEALKPVASELLQRWPVSKRVNSADAPDDESSLIVVDTSVAVSNEILAATRALARELPSDYASSM